jgi:hypothetical protein
MMCFSTPCDRFRSRAHSREGDGAAYSAREQRLRCERVKVMVLESSVCAAKKQRLSCTKATVMVSESTGYGVQK